MNAELTIAIVATLLAASMIAFLGVRLVQALVFYRLMRMVREYPNIAMALALAARGDDAETNRFRIWAAQSIDSRGWAETDEILGTMLTQLYPLSAAGTRPGKPGAEPRHITLDDFR